jgi:CheY-like chemotaxis protein
MSKRVLVVEDEHKAREEICKLLEEHGYEVEGVADGNAALEAASSTRPDCVITDLLIPGLHGFEVLQRFGDSARTRRVPVVIVSAKAYPADIRAATELGARAFLRKPFNPEELLATVHRLVWGTRVTFWGVRGSIATPGAETVRYGGNTPCVTVEHGDDMLILDAGTGLRKLGVALEAELNAVPLALYMLITHTHWDHIQGFPFFTPAYVAGNKITVWGPPSVDKPLERVLRGQMDPSYFPVGLGDMAADIEVHEIREATIKVGPFKVKACYLNHPGVAMGYRVEVGGHSVTYATDTEPFGAYLGEKGGTAEAAAYGQLRDADLAELARETDLYIADSQYGPEEYEKKRGWGHSSYLDSVDLAIRSSARRLALFSHDPMHDDDSIDCKLDHCRRHVAERGLELEIFAAREGQEVDLGAQLGVEPLD